MTTIPNLLSHTPSADHLAVIDDDGELTYSELSDRVALETESLKSAGIRSGDRVLLLAEPSLTTVVTMLSLWNVGAVAVPVNPKTPATELDAMKTRIEPAQWVPESDVGQIVDVSDTCRNPTLSLESDATIIFTSGSSGHPKAALHSVANHYYSALGANEVMPLHPGDRWLLSLPLYHVGGLAILFRSFLAGSTVVFPSRQPLADQLAGRAVTHVSCVPTQLIRLLTTGQTCPQLRALLLGGAAISAKLVEQALAAGVPVFETYGCTEMSSQVWTSDSSSGIGRLLPNRELKVADDGEILMRGKTLFRGYVTGEVIDPARDADGWYHSGDRGTWENGSLTVLGRKDTMFISGGENIHPETIEQKLLGIEGIESTVVVPIADPEFGMRPVAFLQGTWDERALVNALKNVLPSYMIPVRFMSMPDTAGLKPDRSDLQRQAEQSTL